MSYSPILSDQELSSIMDTCDFCYTVSDNSMAGARILLGDLVFVQACDSVEKGDITLVDYGGEVRIGRYYESGGYSMLVPANPDYVSLVQKSFRIIGKVVAYMSIITPTQEKTE